MSQKSCSCWGDRTVVWLLVSILWWFCFWSLILRSKSFAWLPFTEWSDSAHLFLQAPSQWMPRQGKFEVAWSRHFKIPLDPDLRDSNSRSKLDRARGQYESPATSINLLSRVSERKDSPSWLLFVQSSRDLRWSRTQNGYSASTISVNWPPKDGRRLSQARRSKSQNLSHINRWESA